MKDLVYPPLRVWIMMHNREPTAEEFSYCASLVDAPTHQKVAKFSRREDAWRYLLTRVLPQLVMRQREAPRNSWTFQQTRTGKSYIDSPQMNRSLGYNIAQTRSLVAITFAHGRKHEVVNIGIDVVKLAPPAGVSTFTYAQSLMHKLTQNETQFVSPQEDEEVIIRRISILITLKEAYMKALGQPPGFDFSRIDCDIPNERIWVDGKPLVGWEFRLFKANISLRRGAVSEVYQVVCAIHRGGDRTKFIWSESTQDLEQWVQFVTVDQVLKGLGQLNH